MSLDIRSAKRDFWVNIVNERLLIHNLLGFVILTEKPFDKMVLKKSSYAYHVPVSRRHTKVAGYEDLHTNVF